MISHRMKPARLILLTVLMASPVLYAQQAIYRCGNEYTNNASEAIARGCKVVGGGNLTVVPSLVQPAAPAAATSQVKTNTPASAQPSSSPKVDSSEQRARDADAKGVLETELRKAEQRRDQLRQEFNNGQPEKTSAEVKNNQRYMDRVADMRSQMSRLENDIAALRRELSRFTGKPTS